MRVLIAEDEVSLARSLKYLLEKQKFVVDIVHNGLDALDYFHTTVYNVVVLDIMMPGLDGLGVLKRIRSEKSRVPIMLLTAKSEIEDRVAGLSAGADDYVPKPFATAEFIARVKALSRRSENYTSDQIEIGNVTLDRDTYELCSDSETVRLNTKEYQLLELFLSHPHRIFSSEYIMDNIWGQDSYSGMDVVWTYIGFVRKKLRAVGADVEIRTVRGSGYTLEEENVCKQQKATV